MNLHLTDSQRDQFAATGLIVIESVDDNFPGKFDPVGDWRDLDQPCDTCRSYPGHSPNFWLEPCPNPDCVGGRRVVTLTATCPICRGNGVDPVDIDEICAECLGNCKIELGRFTIPALLPVVHWSENDEETESCVTVGHDNGKAYMSIGWSHNECPLDPLPRPGQFIARPEAVT